MGGEHTPGVPHHHGDMQEIMVDAFLDQNHDERLDEVGEDAPVEQYDERDLEDP